LNIGLQKVMLDPVCVRHDPGADGPVVDQRPVGDGRGSIVDGERSRYEVAVCIVVARPEFSDLADGPRNRVLMALPAGLRIVDRAKPITGALDLIERVLVGGKGRVVGKAIAVKRIEVSRSLRWRKTTGGPRNSER